MIDVPVVALRNRQDIIELLERGEVFTIVEEDELEDELLPRHLRRGRDEDRCTDANEWGSLRD